MKMSKKMITLSLLTCMSSFAQAQTKTPDDFVSSILATQSTSLREGSGVGGGVIYESIIAWCDEIGVILNEAQLEAREILGFNADHVSALRSYYNGLSSAAQSSQDQGDITVSNSFTLKYVARGIKLAQILGVTNIINGEVDSSFSGIKKSESLITFFDWYLGYAKRIGENLDKVFYVPYIIQKNCDGPDCKKIPSVSMIELEKRIFDTTVSFLKKVDLTFVKIKADQNSYYTSIRAEDYLKSLAFITKESSKDLNESLFANAYSCQAKKLNRISEQLKIYLESRGANTNLDAIKLNKFTLEIREIVTSLENKKCF